ncbi:MAG: hypothetical protein EBV20_10615 [Betaproteobacteria bacterium]|jgi:hypothetical protein|nr:hypothetical protein [Betaproteobacteria bacterium]NBP45096.1 hypothetical protein [Betaproteobacteria bacterium]
MNAIKKARKLIQSDPDSDQAQLLAQFVLALESEAMLNVADLYRLDIKNFELVIDILKEWRLDRYYLGKAKLFDVSLQSKELMSRKRS